MKASKLCRYLSSIFFPEERLDKIIELDDARLEIYSSQFSERVVYKKGNLTREIACLSTITDTEPTDDGIIIRGIVMSQYDPRISFDMYANIEMKIAKDGKVVYELIEF